MARKFIELTSGYMAKAFHDEPTFVLLARDICAPLAIKAWIEARIRLGKNTREDAQITEAQSLIAMMESEQEGWSRWSKEKTEPPDGE